MLGGEFAVADLNIAAILQNAYHARIDLSPFPNATTWLRACHNRPAAEKVRRLQQE